jgi:16S rRNA (guanine966-N2)-methyltransferase
MVTSLDSSTDSAGYRGAVTRVIGGRARSIALEVPGSGTRPTSDRVRESLFGALESADAVRDAAVLDLYAGSGALALEAVSRGARSADLVERGAPAAAVVRRNAAKVTKAVGREVPIRVHAASVAAYLRGVIGPFDLVFLDPPYDIADADLAGALAALVPSLSDDAIVIVERASRSAEPEWPAGLVPLRDKRYGDTTMWWAQPDPASQSR